MYKFISKILVVILLIVFTISCSNVEEYSVKIYDEDEYKIFDLSIKESVNVIIPKNQTDSQSLSVIIKDENNDLIIFDGGRIEDAEYLTKIINKYGGSVKAWYITHIHDDHIGALYKILQENKVSIEMLYYDFADFDWYYDKVGDEAGIILLFESALKEYMKTNSIKVINEYHNADKYISFDVKILNNVYKLDSDPINNTSIAYKVIWKDLSMIILGDLGYEGGNLLLKSINNELLKSDIVVLSHHGQNGVDKSVYESISPFIAIWPTSKQIYENINMKYKTFETKKWLNDLGVKYNILSYESATIIR